MTELDTPPPAPPTIEVVAMRVAEALMTDMYDRIAELEARLQRVEHEADEAEHIADAADPEGAAFTETAQELLQRAAELRSSAETLARASPGSDPISDGRVLQLWATESDPEPA